MVDPPSPPGSTQTHPRPVAQHISPAILADPSTRIIDESLFAHSAIFANRVQVNLTNPPQKPERKCIYAASSFIVSVATNGQYSSPVYHVLSHRPAPGKEDENVDELLARQFYRLCCLGRMKLGFEGALPVHLEGVRVALECLEGFVTDGVA